MATSVETIASLLAKAGTPRGDGQPPAPADSKQKGVYWNKILRRWYSSIQLGRKKKYLGLFHSAAEAAAAWERAVREREAAKAAKRKGREEE
jgi:hypothetical protein